MTHRSAAAVTIALASAALLAMGVGLRAETRPIDAGRSKLTVLVYKSGLFSAFADDHVINAPIASGSISDAAPLSIEIVVHSADLRVLDPRLAADKRDEVQTRMLSAAVLDVQKFPEITFTSTTIEPAGAERWTVTGRLAIHGQTHVTTFPVTRTNGTYTGEVVVKQRDFGIEPIRVAGGTVKVKDELKVQFEIVPRS